MTIYENIKRICKQNSIPIGVLEKDLKIANGYISKWDAHSPSIETVKAIADYLNVTVDELISDE